MLTRAEDDFPGTPTSPLDDAGLRAKYLRCARDVAGAERLLDQLMGIESVRDVRTLPLG